MHRIVEVEAKEGYRLRVAFADGLTGEVDLTDRLLGPLFEPLRDVVAFAQVRIDEFGVPCWPNGADLAPDALRRTIESDALAERRP